MSVNSLFVITVLWALGTMVHDVRDVWHMEANCVCEFAKTKSSVLHPKNGMSQRLFTLPPHISEHLSQKDSPLVNGLDLVANTNKNASNTSTMVDSSGLNGSQIMSPLNLLAEAAATRECESNKDTDSNSSSGSNNKVCSTLRDLLTRQGTVAGGKTPSDSTNTGKKQGIDSVIKEAFDKNQPKDNTICPSQRQQSKPVMLQHFVPRSGSQMQGRNSPIPTYTLKETSVIYPDIPHSWLDHGRLLRLHDPRCSLNIHMFQQQWRRGQPIIVSHCDKQLNKELWTPKSFGRDFGHKENDLVNCTNGIVMMGQKMKVFWDGFEKLGGEWLII